MSRFCENFLPACTKKSSSIYFSTRFSGNFLLSVIINNHCFPFNSATWITIPLFFFFSPPQFHCLEILLQSTSHWPHCDPPSTIHRSFELRGSWENNRVVVAVVEGKQQNCGWKTIVLWRWWKENNGNLVMVKEGGKQYNCVGGGGGKTMKIGDEAKNPHYSWFQLWY